MFERIPVPTPFEVGRVNAYLAGRTVVDPGPDSEEAWEVLCDGLREHGLTPEDVEQVVVTHGHLDHFGLAKRFRNRGARVLAHPHAAEAIADAAARFRRQQSYFGPFFERCGVSPALAESVVTLPDSFLQYGPPVETDRLLADGDTIPVADTSVTVEHTGGHGPGELALSYERNGTRRAVVGDTVLGHITPNPFLMPPRTDGEERPRQLLRLRQSLERLENGEYDRFLPGHGEEITNPSARIREMKAAQDRRTERVRELLDGRTRPVDVVDGLFGDLPATETFPAMSEVIGHLDRLIARNEVEQELVDGSLFYRVQSSETET